MIKISLSIVLFIVSTSLYSQNNSNCYHLLIKELYIQASFEAYDSCVAIVDLIETKFVIQPNHSLKVAEVLAESTEKNKAFNYLYKIIESYDLSLDDIYKNKHLNKLVNNSKWSEFLIAYPKLRQVYCDNFNTEYYNEIEKIFHFDQFPRMYLSEHENFPELLNITDSINGIAIIKLLESKGFPSQIEVGGNCLKHLYIIMMHLSTRSRFYFEKFEKYLYDEVVKMNMNPYFYANYLDRYYQYTSGIQVYGNFITRKENGKQVFGSIQNIHNIDSLRLEIGLGTLKEFANDLSIKTLPENYSPVEDPLKFCNCR